jgi:hypothetical protein
MQLPFNLASTLPPKMLGNAPAEPLEKGEDGEARMEQVGQFSSLLTQAMIQQASELPTKASAEDAGAANPDTLATGEGSAEISLTTTSGDVTDTAGEDGLSRLEAPSGFSVNLLATLQPLLHPSSPPGMAPQAIAETPVSAGIQSVHVLSPSLPEGSSTPNLPDPALSDPNASVLQDSTALPSPALSKHGHIQASDSVADPFLQPEMTDRKLSSDGGPVSDGQPLTSREAHTESADAAGMMTEQLSSQNAGFSQVLSLLDSSPPGLTVPMSSTSTVPETQSYQPVSAASLPLSGVQGGLSEPLPALSSASESSIQTPAFQLPSSSSTDATVFTPSPSAGDANVIGASEGSPLPDAAPVSAPGLQAGMPQLVSESAFGEIAFSMAPAPRQAIGLDGQKPGKLEELQKHLSQLGGSMEAPTSQPVPGENPIDSPFGAVGQSPAQAETFKPSATDEAFAGPIEGGALSEALLGQPDSAPVEPVTVSISGATGGVPGNSGASQGSIPQFVSQARHPMEQVLEGTAYSVKNGHKELTIRLNPDNLGEVRVNLVSLGNNELSARLIASTQESHALLQSQVDTLKTSLEAQGIRVEHLTVVLAGRLDAQSHTGQGAGSGQQQPHYQQSSSHSGNLAQQDFNGQEQPGSNVFAQMNQSGGGPFQQKYGFAQNPINAPYRGAADEAASGETIRAETRSQGHDNGSISILA